MNRYAFGHTYLCSVICRVKSSFVFRHVTEAKQQKFHIYWPCTRGSVSELELSADFNFFCNISINCTAWIWTEYRKIRIRNNSVFGNFSRSVASTCLKFLSDLTCSSCISADTFKSKRAATRGCLKKIYYPLL